MRVRGVTDCRRNTVPRPDSANLCCVMSSQLPLTRRALTGFGRTAPSVANVLSTPDVEVIAEAWDLWGYEVRLVESDDNTVYAEHKAEPMRPFA